MNEADARRLMEAGMVPAGAAAGAGAAGAAAGGMPGGAGGAAEQRERAAAAEQQRQEMLAQVLTPEARERLSRVAMVKPETARAVENSVIQAARTGRLTQRVDEDQVIAMLGRFGEQKAKATTSKITFARRRLDDSDEDDD